jgi:hypothetical protein
MDNAVWRALLRLLTPDLAENLLVVTKNRTEFAVQGIIRDVDDFLIIRGRLTGVAEASVNVYFIPFDAIQYLGFARDVREPEVRAIFPSEARISPVGVPSSPAPVRELAPVRAAPAPTEPATEAEAPPAPEVAPATEPEPAKPKSDVRPVGAAKAALLERLRARRAALDPKAAPK